MERTTIKTQTITGTGRKGAEDKKFKCVLLHRSLHRKKNSKGLDGKAGSDDKSVNHDKYLSLSTIGG